MTPRTAMAIAWGMLVATAVLLLGLDLVAPALCTTVVGLALGWWAIRRSMR